jgi:hypothetical protein
VTQGWTELQIHDTVAAIARQPEYGGAARQSLIGRFFRYVIGRIGDLFDWMRGSLDARIVVIAAVVLVALVVIGRIVVERQLSDRRRSSRGAGVARGQRQDFWRLADELASERRFAEASHALYAAVLNALASEGLVKYHASKTNGDYARELRRAGSPRAAAFRAFALAFDRAAYGTVEVTASVYEQLRRDAQLALEARAAA